MPRFINMPKGFRPAPGLEKLVKFQDGKMLVPEGMEEDKAKEIAARAIGQNRMLAKFASYQASADDRKKVASILGKAEEEVAAYGIYRVLASSSRKDYQDDRLSKAVLERMGQQYAEGYTVTLMHSPSIGIGSTFEYEISDAGDGQTELFVKFYVSPDAQLPSGNAVKLLNDGVYRRVSIASLMRMTAYVPAEKDGEQGYFWYDEPDTVQVLELAVVHMGMNRDAKMASVGTSDFWGSDTFGQIHEETDTDMEKIKVILPGDVEVELENSAAEPLQALAKA